MSDAPTRGRQRKDAAAQPPDPRLAPCLAFWAAVQEEETYRPTPPISFVEAPKRFIPVLGQGDTLFTSGTQRGALNGADPSLRQFLQPPAPERLIYGYPVSMDQRGFLQPLFFQVVKVTMENNQPVLVPGDQRGIRANPGPLRILGFDDGVIAGLIGKIQDAAVPFAERLAFVGRYLGFDPNYINPAQFGVWPTQPDEGRVTWINRPILASTPRTRNEIAELAQPARLPQIAGTALSVYAAPQPPKKRRMVDDHLTGPVVIEVHRLGPSQTQAVRSAMTHPLTAVASPPGSGKSPAMVNLAATAVMSNQTVLYVAPTADAVRNFAMYIDSMVDRQWPWALRLGLGEDLQATREGLFKMMSAVAKAAKEKANQEKADGAAGKRGGGSGREKPSMRMLAEFDLSADDTRDQLEPARHALDRLRPLQHKRLQMTADLGAVWRDCIAKKKKPNITAERLKQLREEAAVVSGKTSQSFGGLLKSLTTFGSKTAPIFEALRNAANGLTPEARDEIMEGIDKDSPAQVLYKAIDRLARYDILLQQLGKEQELLNEMRKKYKDAEYIQGRLDFALSQKVAGARELVAEFWRELVLGALPKTGKFAIIYFDLLKKRPQAYAEGPQSAEVIDADLAIAVRETGGGFPLWCIPADKVPAFLPLAAGLFDLVIIDEAHKMDPGAVIPLLFRGKRAMLLGAARRESRLSPLAEKTIQELQKGYLAAHPQPLDPRRNAIGQARASAEAAGEKLRVLHDHFRSHPLIADYINRTFYEGKLLIFTNFRSVREGFDPDYLGVHWNETAGKMAADRAGMFNESELNQAIALMQAWEADGVFKHVPRRSIGMVTPFPAAVARLRALAANQKWPEPVMQRLTIGLPRDFRGAQVDLLILLPGICAGLAPGMTTAIAKSEGLFHDAVAAARCGIHVLCESEACSPLGIRGGSGSARPIPTRSSRASPSPARCRKRPAT
ncbi:MAG: hypothetical protein FJX47_03580 [Alphaproteobacteria bacterium]|nr:hypothetical protein [Alphaproteobacteria bacterium]